jgi:hypothetical protein
MTDTVSADAVPALHVTTDRDLSRRHCAYESWAIVDWDEKWGSIKIKSFPY